MSEPNNTFPFPGIEAGGTLDISAIFGSSTSGGDLNPFEMPAAKGPVEMDPLPQEYAPAAGPKLEPAAEAESAAEPETEQPSAAPAPEEEVVTGPTWKQAVPPPNLISAAFDKQEEKNTQQGLLEKPPVFAYGSAKEPIKDPGMTFEELRIDKAEDFPELAEGKKVSWTVEYGKTVKIITDPKGTTIQSIKAEIEQSKAFLDGLKKAKDKNPDCLVKPRVTAQSKGIAAYKGVFSSLEEARASDKTICIVPAGDGRIYELRKSELGEFIVPKNNVVEFPQIRAGFTPALPLIPMFLLGEVISFFRCYMNEREEFEAMAHILWDKENEEFVVHIPEQEVSKAHINADLSRDTLPESRYLHYADIHSHNSMEARFSSTDDRDEKATRLYIVLGRLDRFFPEISVRMSCGGVFQPLDPATVLESVGEVFPHQWHDNVKKQPRPPPPHGGRFALDGDSYLERCAMKFSQTRPVKIVMLGAGGTGGHIAPHLYRLLYSLERPVRFIICDGDVVEEKNLVRQNFIQADLGENKAKVLAERYSTVFGLETEYVPSFVEKEDDLRRLLKPDHWRIDRAKFIWEQVILIGAVDNNKSRQLCHHVFQEAKELIYIDSGNGEYTGQVVCGIRRGGKTYYPPIGAVYPDVLGDTDKFPTELSCAEASVSAPQSMAANITAATAVVSMVYNILALGDSSVRKITFSTRTVNVRPEVQKKRRKAA